MKKFKFLKILLVSIAIFCTISIGAVSSYMFFKNIAGSAVLADTWESKLEEEMEKEDFEEPTQIEDKRSSFKDYYEIDSSIKLAWVAYQVNNKGNYNIKFFLANDINLSGHNWVPIGLDNSHSFCGKFDGNGFTIRNMIITSCEKDSVGLFGKVDDNTEIKNFTMENPKIALEKVAGFYVGTVCGYFCGENLLIKDINILYPKISIHNYEVSSWDNYCGGIVGYCYGVGNLTIGNCKVYASNDSFIKATTEKSVLEDLFVGGIAGYFEEWSYSEDINKIIDCYNNVEISAETGEKGFNLVCSGGIVGGLDLSSGNISNCLNEGLIKTKNRYTAYAGGIVGYSSGGTIENCLNTGKIEDTSSEIGGKLSEETKEDSNDSTKADSGDFPNTATMTYKDNAGTFIPETSNKLAMIYRVHKTNGNGSDDCNGTNKTEPNYVKRLYYSTIGGIAGYIKKGTIKSCVNTGEIVKSDSVKNLHKVQVTYKIKAKSNNKNKDFYSRTACTYNVDFYSKYYCADICGGYKELISRDDGSNVNILNCYGIKSLQKDDALVKISQKLIYRAYTYEADTNGGSWAWRDYGYELKEPVHEGEFLYVNFPVTCTSTSKAEGKGYYYIGLSAFAALYEPYTVYFNAYNETSSNETNYVGYATLKLWNLPGVENDNLQTNNGTSISKNNLPSNLNSDIWAVDSTGTINGGYPYLKTFYW